MFSPEQIIKKAEELHELNENTAQALMDKFSKEQPYVLGYIIATGENFEDPTHAESLITLSVLIWSVYTEAYPKHEQVSEEIIYTCENEHFEKLKEIEDKSGEAFDAAVNEMVNSRPQPVLNDFLNQEIAQSFGNLAGTAFAVSNVIVEAFEQTISKN